MIIQKIILISLAFSLVTLSKAQTRFAEKQDPYIQFVHKTPVDCKFPPNTKTVILEETHLDKKRNYVKNLDELGRVYEFHTESQDYNEHITYTCNFGEGKTSTGTYTYYSGKDKIEYVIIHETNTLGKPVSQTTKDGKGKLIEKVVWTYNDFGMIENTLIVEGEKENVVNEWKYYYDADKMPEKIELFDSKGRVEHEWVYNCNELKKSVSTIKNTHQICTWEGEDGDYYTVNEQIFDDKGGYLQHIWRYTPDERNIVAYLIYDETNKLVLKEEYDESYEKPTQIKKFSKGSVDNKGVFMYTDGLMTNYSEYDSKNTLIQHNLFIYNDEGFMTRARIYDESNKNEKTIVIKHRP